MRCSRVRDKKCEEGVKGERFWVGSSGLVTQQTTAYTKITFKIPFTKKTTIIIIIIIINIIITILFEARCSYLKEGAGLYSMLFLCRPI